MANWEASFTQLLSFDLENGLLGNPSDTANAITQYYVGSVLTGQLTSVPPVLPSPAASGAPVPVGGVTTINGYDARQRLFFETLRVYFEGQALLQGKTNIQDLIVTYRRLVIKFKALNNKVRTNAALVREVARELRDLPQTLKEMVQALVEYIKELLYEIKQLPNVFTSFRNELDPATFANLFRSELELIDSVGNFNPTINPRDYRRLGLQLTGIGRNINRLQYDLSSSATIKAYVYRKLQGAISIIMSLVEGFTNPAVIIDVLEDIARIKRKYQRIVRVARVFVKNSRMLQTKLNKLKIERKKIQVEIEGVIKPKVALLKALIKERTNEFTNKLLKFKQSGVILKVAKKVKEEGQVKQKKIKKTVNRIKQIRKVASLTVDLILKIDAITIAIGLAVEELRTTAASLQSNIVTRTVQTRSELERLIRTRLGIKDTTIITTLVSIAVQYRLSIDDIKFLLRQNTNNITQIYATAKSLLEEDIPNLKRAIQQIQRDRKPKTRAKKDPSLISLSNIFTQLKGELVEIKQYLNVKIKELNVYIDKQKQDLKVFVNQYVNNLKELNATLNQKLNRIGQRKGEATEKKKEVADRKRQLEKIACGARFAVAATKVATSATAPGFTLSQNQQSINKMLQEYYLFLKLDYELTPEESARQLQVKRTQFKKVLQTESLYNVMRLLITEIQSGEFIQELDRRITEIQSELSSEFQSTYNAFKNLFKPGQNLLNSLERLNVSVLGNINFVQQLYVLEQRYLGKFKQSVRQIRDLQQGSIVSGGLLNNFYKSVEKTNSIILLLIDLIIKAAKEARDFVLSLVRPAIKKVRLKIDQAKDKQIEKARKNLEARAEKKFNLEALTLQLTMNIATRLFWTGFSWTNPAGTTFIATNIGPYGKLNLTAVGGARGYASELARNFQLQLVALTGTVIPNAATGIPPFPFVGLI